LDSCTSLIATSNYQLVITAHAKKRMAERKITIADILEALRDPVQIFYDEERDTYLVLGLNNIAVVVSIKGLRIEVVTVMKRREYEALTGRLGDRRYKLIC
jgi:hypothetical protein